LNDDGYTLPDAGDGMDLDWEMMEEELQDDDTIALAVRDAVGTR
jgi:hypothetical protein